MFRKKPNNQIMHHVSEIIRIMEETSPEGAEVQGFEFRIVNGEPHSLWGSARLPSGNLTHIRPGITQGWNERKLVLVGA